MNEEEELEDDKSPLEQGIKIQRNRVMTIVDRVIEKLELAFCLNTLLSNDCEQLRNCLTETEINDLVEVYASIEKECSVLSSSKSLATSKSKNKSGVLSGETQIREKCSVLIIVLFHNESIMKKVKDILRTKQLQCKEFLNMIYRLRKFIYGQMMDSAVVERNKNKRIGRAWMNNEKYKKIITDMEVIRNKKLEELAIILKEKYAIINHYKKQIEISNDKCEQQINQLINVSGHNMYDTAAASEERQQVLSNEMKFVTNQYETLLSTHLQTEKQLRVKLSKIESLLSQWLAKYDQDVGQLYMELDELTDGYNKEKAEYEDLQERFAIQKVLYDELMKEKAEEEQRILDERRYEFMKKRSARIIQRWWRTILAKIWKKKKGKKGKKGKGKKK